MRKHIAMLTSLARRKCRNARPDAISFLAAAVAAIALSVSLNACGKKLPDPVKRKDGYAYIPIADTAFLMPEKTWLKSYGRNSTDGLVDSFYLHVTAPDIQPWSKEVNSQMYPPAGPGQRVDVEVRDIRGEPLANQYESFYTLPQRRAGRLLEEIESDLAAYGLRKFRDPQRNDPMFYLSIERERVRYFTRCDENSNPSHHNFCHLRFPWSRAIYVDMVFTKNYLPNAIQMAEKITAKLKEFEAAGHAYQLKLDQN